MPYFMQPSFVALPSLRKATVLFSKNSTIMVSTLVSPKNIPNRNGIIKDCTTYDEADN